MMDKKKSNFSTDVFFDIDFRKYELSELLGRGTYGEVWRAKQDDLESDEIGHRNVHVAVKIIRPDKATKETFHSEVSTLRSVKHPNIIEIFGACTSPILAVITEYMECGSLDHLLHLCGRIDYTVNHVFCWAIQCTTALSYLHLRGIAHGDLKPANMLLCDRYRLLKLSDFGTAARLFKDDDYRHGSAPWMAPEICESRPSPEADVYSFGISLWEMITRSRPYARCKSSEEVFWAAFSGERPERILGCPEYVMKFIERCWDEDPLRRPDTSQVEKFLLTSVDCAENAIHSSALQPLINESNGLSVVKNCERKISVDHAAGDAANNDCSNGISTDLHRKLKRKHHLIAKILGDAITEAADHSESAVMKQW